MSVRCEMPRTDATSAVLSQVEVCRGVGLRMSSTLKHHLLGNKEKVHNP